MLTWYYFRVLRRISLYTLTFTCLVLFSAAPLVTRAQSEPLGDSQAEGSGQFITCSGTTCSACDLVSLANNVVDWLIAFLAVLFAVIMVVAGFRLVTSGGNQSAMENAKSSLTNGLIGFLIVLGAWLAIDTLMRALVGDSGQINGATPWSEIQCWTQNTPRVVQFAADEDRSNFYSSGTGVAGSAGGGQCTELASGPCSAGTLAPYFGTRAVDASILCSKESGGAPIESKTDLCSDGKSFSGGLFQINIISEADKIPGCVKSELVENPGLGNGGIGDCAVPRVTSSKGVTYCPRRECKIKSDAMYATCMQAVRVQSVNLQVAQKLFEARGFQPWQISRDFCKIPN